jgi:hypothetical protein
MKAQVQRSEGFNCLDRLIVKAERLHTRLY